MPKYISRIDASTTNTRGWYVRLYKDGTDWCRKFFSDSKFNKSETDSLLAAIDYRDSQIINFIKKHGYHPISRQPVKFYTKPFKHNTTTFICGVHKSHEFSRTWPVRTIIFYSATWSEDGKAKSKKFYITKNRTSEEALNAAIEYRHQKETELQK